MNVNNSFFYACTFKPYIILFSTFFSETEIKMEKYDNIEYEGLFCFYQGKNQHFEDDILHHS